MHEAGEVRGTLGGASGGSVIAGVLLAWLRNLKGYHAVRIALALLLLTAAVLKAHQLATEPIFREGILYSPWVTIAVVDFEVFFGLWLLSGIYPKQSWWLAAGCFSLFAVVSVFRALAGEPSCGCFGKVAVRPWYTAALDLAIVAALMCWRPRVGKGNATVGEISLRMKLAISSAAFLLAAATAGLWLAHARASSSGSQAGLWIDPAELDFGETWAQSGFAWTLHVSNLTSEDITIKSFEASCACASIEPRSFVVPAGLAVPVRLSLDLRRMQPNGASQSVESSVVQLQPLVADYPPNWIRWNLHGRVRRYPLVLTDSLVNFGEVFQADDSSPSRTLEVECQDLVSAISVRCDQPIATARVIDAGDDGNKRRLEVSLRAGLSPGRHECKLFLKPAPSASNAELTDVPEIVIPVRVTVLHDVYVAPATVSFGAMKVGEGQEQMIAVRSMRGKPFEIVDVTVDGAGDLEVKRLGRQEGAEMFRISQRASKPGMHISSIRFVVLERSGKKRYELRVDSAYHGLSK